jgi:hypothetical protein
MPRDKGLAARRGEDEIVEEIAVHLRPWKARQTGKAVAIRVSEQMKLLREFVPLQAKLFDRRRLRAHAQKLDKSLAEVQEILVTDPGGLNLHLFRPDSWSSDEMNSMEAMALAFQRRSEPLAAELARLRKVCARAINPGFGLHPNHDHAKGLCPWFARGLMLELSNAKITGTKDASFRVISSLLYEAISGEPNADLKRACDEVLRNTAGGYDDD